MPSAPLSTYTSKDTKLNNMYFKATCGKTSKKKKKIISIILK